MVSEPNSPRAPWNRANPKKRAATAIPVLDIAPMLEGPPAVPLFPVEGAPLLRFVGRRDGSEECDLNALDYVREMEAAPIRRRGKEVRERTLAALMLVPASPIFAICTLLIKLEGLVRPDARGPVFFTETRISRGKPFGLLKFRTLRASSLAALPPGQPTHIALLEKAGGLTWSGRLIRQWYLDELPQLLNIVRGDMFLIGTRPWPLELYEADIAKGRTLKRDMPAGLIGPVQAAKGLPVEVDLDDEYWEAFRTLSPWQLFRLDLKIIRDSLRVQLEHKGI